MDSGMPRETDVAHALREQERRVRDLRRLAELRPTNLVVLASLRNEEELFVLQGGTLDRLAAEEAS
jgi:hypothetical protein